MKNFSSTVFILALAAVFVASAHAQSISVIACGADPTGRGDSTGAFEKCLRGTPTGDLFIPKGVYRLTRTIYKTRNQNLIGSGSKGSILKCDVIQAPCVVAADSIAGSNNYSVSSIQNLGLEGPGANTGSTGILLGGDPEKKAIVAGAFGDSVNLNAVRVTGFYHGIAWGNNAYANKLLQCSIFENGSGLFAPAGLQNSGEAISITDSDIFNNRTYGIEDHANFEWTIQGTSFDYNITAIAFYGSTIHVTGCHFEQQSAQVFFQPFGRAALSIRDSQILIQAKSGQEKYILSLWPQSLVLVIDDVSIWSNHPIQYFMRVQGQVSGTISVLYGNGNKQIKALSDAKSDAILTGIQAF